MNKGLLCCIILELRGTVRFRNGNFECNCLKLDLWRNNFKSLRKVLLSYS